MGSYVISDFGRLVYLPGEEFTSKESGLAWVDRLGDTEAIPLPPGVYADPELSPDGQSLAVTATQTDGTSDIWVYDLFRGTFGRRTFAENARNPLWTPDGSQLVYQTSEPLGRGELWSANADGTGQAEQILATPATPDSFSTIDGTLLYLEGAIGASSISTLSYRDSTWIPAPLTDSQFTPWGGVVSPDGRWIAMVTVESGRQEVYVRPYPNMENGKWQISTQGGREPQWNPQGGELFYLQQDGDLMSVNIDSGNSFSSGILQQLLSGFYVDLFNPPSYGVSGDGERFIRFQGPREQLESELDIGPASLTVVENWFEELNRLSTPVQN